MLTLPQKIEETVAYIRSQTNFQPQLGIILGTGLGNLAKEIEVEKELPYGQIPHFPVSTVESHQGKLLFGQLAGKPVVAMQGRFHYYEGYSAEEITFPVRVLKMLDIEKLFVSNAAGGLNLDMQNGDLMVIEDHINLQPDNPLRGKNYEALGPRFPDMSQPYEPQLIEKALAIAEKHGIRCMKGVYVSVPGPNLETKAEYVFLHRIGADAVGMSTVPEVLVANHMGLPVFAMSIITDMGYPPEKVKHVTLEEVIAIASEAEPKMTVIMKELIAQL